MPSFGGSAARGAPAADSQQQLQEHPPTTVSGLPYEEYEPIYADVDALRRGSFCELYVHVSRTGNLSRKFASVSPLIISII